MGRGNICSGKCKDDPSIEEDAIFIDRYFEPDGSYGVTFRLIADEGYAFAEDLQVVVNNRL